MSFGPEGIQVLIEALAESPLDAIENHVSSRPQPPPDTATLQPGDVVVRVRAAQVNWVDLIMLSGQYQHVPEPPYCPGLEYSGDVVWVGADVERHRVGDRVMADGLSTGPRSLGDYRAYGGFATYSVAPQDALIPLPEGLDHAQGTSLLGGYETAYHCLVHRGKLTEGEAVLIHGATGTTGLAAVQLAKHIGALVVATTRSDEKAEVLRKVGVDHVIRTGEGVSLRDAVRAVHPKGVDVVYDPVGGPISAQSLRCMRFGGRFLIVGWAATPTAARKAAPNQLPTNLIMMKGLDVLGCPAVISTHRDPSIRPPRLRAILEAVESGALRPIVGRHYPLTEIKEAMRAKWESRFVGTVVVEP